MIETILLGIEIVFILLLTIVIHEAGHILTYRLIIGKIPKVNITRKGLYINLDGINNLHKLSILLNGILFGFFFLMLWALDRFEFVGVLVFLVMYIAGSFWDIILIIKSVKKGDDKIVK